MTTARPKRDEPSPSWQWRRVQLQARGKGAQAALAVAGDWRMIGDDVSKMSRESVAGCWGGNRRRGLIITGWADL